MKRIVLFGCYGLFNPDADFGKCTDDIKAMGFTGASVILDNRWVSPPQPDRCFTWWPWDKMKMCYDMNTLNLPVFATFRKMCETFGSKGLDLFIKFQSPYYKSSWNKFPALKQKTHPYLNNSTGISLDGDANQLYSMITFGPTHFHILKWDIISEPKNKFKFSVADKMGAPWLKAHQRLIKIIGEVRQKYPLWRFGYAPNNEEQAGSLGDRSELHSWFHDEFKAAGMDIGATFFRVVNRQGNDSQNRQIHLDCGKKWGQNFGLEATQEFHIDGVADRDHLVSIGIQPSRTLFSNDGAPETPAFVAESRALYKKGDPMVDLKYWEGIGGNIPVAPYRWMVNWKNAALKHGAIIA